VSAAQDRPTATPRLGDLPDGGQVDRYVRGEQRVGTAKCVAHRVRDVGGTSLARDAFDSTRPTKVGERALVERSELDLAHIAKVIAKCIAAIGSAGSVAEEMGVAVKLDAQLGKVSPYHS
jgi:hypothetical protein